MRPGVASRRDGPVPQEPAQLLVLLQHHRVAPLQVRDQPLVLGVLRGQAVDLQLLTQDPRSSSSASACCSCAVLGAAFGRFAAG